jgi:asparaginyl-tRNA synthetase
MCEKLEYVELTSGVLRYTTEFFHARGFTQLMPVMLSPVTDPLGPDPGSTVIKTGEIEYLDQKLSLTQSMILHKQLALKKGLKKIFIVSPNVRLEHPERRATGKHLFEFSQVDFEIAGGKMDDVFSLMEDYLSGLVLHMKDRHSPLLKSLGRRLPMVKGPFPRHTTMELKEKYGPDWEAELSSKSEQPFWALSHKREFYDREDPSAPGTYLNYDLVYPEGYCEALSGAEREYEYDSILRRIGRDGIGTSRYKPYLELAKTGLVPSAGGGFGVERLVRFLAGAKHVGDVQLFRRVPGETVVV